MDVVETAIRSAFEKGNPADPAFRDKVYRSVLAALERALQSNPDLSAEAVENRRANVRAKIDEIESEFVPAVEVDSPAGVAPSLDAELRRERAREAGATPPPAAPEPERAYYVEPRIEDRPASDAGHKPVVAEALAGDAGRYDGIEPEYREDKRRLPWGGLFSAMVVLVLAGAGVWWVISSGFFERSDVAVKTPERPAAPTVTEAETQAPQSETEAAQDWITVFSPDDPTRVSAPAGTQAEVLEDDSGKFLRIRSGTDGAPVSFDIGQGILERIAGRHAVFDLVARTEEDTPTQISVTCELGELGDCGRRRYAVGYERGEFLFDIELPNSRPNSSGALEVISDIENGGKAIDIYEIRVSVTQ